MTAAALADRFVAQVPPALQALLREAATIAAVQRTRLYLVGGPVRDLIMRQPLTDVDLVTDGDAWPVAEAFATHTGGHLTEHAAFRTATVGLVVDAQPLAIDFVTARREVYPEPAALPVITPSTMRDDLQRRDFTINALALELRPDTVGDLLDPFGGARDIDAGRLRVLHNQSFIDDPTRILRGARFAARFGFAVEPDTRALLDRAIAAQMLARVSPQRILNELWLVLQEPRPAAALALLNEWGALDQLGLTWDADWPRLFSRLHDAADLPDAERELAAFGLLVWPLGTRGRARFGQRYNLPRAERRVLDELPATAPPLMLAEHPDPARVEQELGRFSPATIFVLEAAALDRADQPVLRMIARLRRMPPLLSGDDLRARGVAPGPQYRTILAQLRAAQLRGTLATRAAALRWLQTQGIGVDPPAADGASED